MSAAPGRSQASSHRSAQHEGTPVSVEQVDSSFLQSLLGYHARRATLAIIGLFLERMAVYQLRPVDFSILSLITHNPGITSRQLCTTLGIQPPNLVAMIGALDRRGLITRAPHRKDGRALSLYLSQDGEELMREAEQTAAALEREAAARLSESERRTLIRLLQKVYL
jgi:DNA-binding MarR family transcriptional regulator